MLPIDHKKLQPIVLIRRLDDLRWLTLVERCKLVDVQAIPHVNNVQNEDRKKRVALGHREIIKRFRNSNAEYGFVLEDDACFSVDFVKFYPQLIKELNELEWDLFYFGGNILSEDQVRRVSDNIICPKMLYCNHGYLIHNKAYQTAMDLLENTDRSVDDTFARANWNLLASRKMIISQMPVVGFFEDLFLVHNIMLNSYAMRSYD